MVRKAFVAEKVRYGHRWWGKLVYIKQQRTCCRLRSLIYDMWVWLHVLRKSADRANGTCTFFVENWTYWKLFDWYSVLHYLTRTYFLLKVKFCDIYHDFYLTIHLFQFFNLILLLSWHLIKTNCPQEAKYFDQSYQITSHVLYHLRISQVWIFSDQCVQKSLTASQFARSCNSWAYA